MARLTVRNLDDDVMQHLRERGAARGVSMEQEARDVLAASLGLPTTEGFDARTIVPQFPTEQLTHLLREQSDGHIDDPRSG